MDINKKSKVNQLGRIRQCLDEAGQMVDVFPVGELQALRERAASNHFNLVVVGEFKRGKSSILNALIGADILPVGVVPLTAIATVLQYGQQAQLKVAFNDGTEQVHQLDELWDYATEKGNPENIKDVAEVRINWPSPWLKNGVRLVDTPGIGSIYRHNSDVTRDFLPKADAVLFVLSVDQPVGQAEYDFLQEVRAYAGKVFFLLNKADLLSTAELEEASTFTRSVLERAMGGSQPALFPVSAQQALQSLRYRDEEHKGQYEKALSQSGFTPFGRELEHFLMQEKGNALATALAKGLRRLVVQARFNTELALSSLNAPVAELQQKLDVFAEKRVEISQEKHDFRVLLAAEIKQLIDTELAVDIDAAAAIITTQVREKVQARFDTAHKASLHDLHETLRQTALESVRNGWDSFRKDEDKKLEVAFQAAVKRFSVKVDATVDALYHFSADLFSIPYETVNANAAWQAKSGFYYKFWEMPGSIVIVGRSALHALPKFIGDRLVLKASLRYGDELVDTQAGRLRYDFVQRLQKSESDFRKIMLDRIDSTLEGIERAVTKGLEVNETNSAEAQKQKQRLQHNLEQLHGFDKRIV